MMRDATFLIFASEWYEVFGLTILEAFATGMPVICSRLGAPAEIVEDNKTGLLFTPGDAADLVRKVSWAVQHPDIMAQMGRNARIVFEDKYHA